MNLCFLLCIYVLCLFIVDGVNYCIYILDYEGKLLGYVENVNEFVGLCVDKFDNVFVVEYKIGVVKVIKYFK